jgi:hypothetical protein
MSEKQIKRYKKTIKKAQNKVIKEHVKYVQQMKLFKRFKYALIIIFKIKRGL